LSLGQDAGINYFPQILQGPTLPQPPTPNSI
jgi:hypothetical protein